MDVVSGLSVGTALRAPALYLSSSAGALEAIPLYLPNYMIDQRRGYRHESDGCDKGTQSDYGGISGRKVLS